MTKPWRVGEEKEITVPVLVPVLEEKEEEEQ